MSNLDADKSLLAALDEDLEPESTGSLSPLDQRIFSGFEDIVRFFKSHGRVPLHGNDHDIFERIYAVRLDRLREMPEAHALLGAHDHAHLLLRAQQPVSSLGDEELLKLLGADDQNDITRLRHVRSAAEKREAEEIADRKACPDFDKFKGLFKLTKSELESGVRTALPFKDNISIQQGHFFILSGMVVYVAEITDETRVAPNGIQDARLRLIYDNGTESNLWQTSLRRALNKDEDGRRITGNSDGPLFEDTETEFVETGTVYVLRSHSDHPFISEHRDLVHKIGVTGGSIEQRIAGADKQSTYLLADVEVVATYKLHNMNRVKVEKLLHRLFSGARLNVSISDRFGNPVEPREWFLVPLHVIDEAVERLRDGSITGFVYNPNQASLEPI